MLQTLMDLLSIQSYPGEEKEAREYAISKLKEIGFATSIDELGNLYAVRGEPPYVLLNAHMDSVKPYEAKNYYGGNYNSRYTPPSKKWLWYRSDKFAVSKSIQIDVDKSDKRSCARCSLFYSCYSSVSTMTMSDEEVQEEVKELTKGKKLCFTSSQYYKDEREDEKEEEIEKPKQEKKTLNLVYNETTKEITAPKAYRPMGGDDKCGMAIAIQLATDLPTKIGLKILFTVQEEVGCVGIKHAVKTYPQFFSDCLYSLTADRKGGNDICVTTGGESNVATRGYLADLAKYAIMSGMLPTFAAGTSSDNYHIKYLVPNAINVSAGYYSPHMSSEYIKFGETQRTYTMLKNFILRHKVK